MGSKYPVLPPKIVVKFLESKGFVFISQKGSHLKYSKDGKIVIVPNHDEIAKGTLKSILLQADIVLDDLLEWL